MWPSYCLLCVSYINLRSGGQYFRLGGQYLWPPSPQEVISMQPPTPCQSGPGYYSVWSREADNQSNGGMLGEGGGRGFSGLVKNTVGFLNLGLNSFLYQRNELDSVPGLCAL